VERGDGMKGMTPTMGTRWALALVTGGLIAAATACSGGGDGGAEDNAGLEDPGDCVVVDIASSPEKLELLGALAESFNGSDAARMPNDGCAFVRVQNKSSGAAEQLLANGWDEAVDGPRPVIWSPAASTWGQVLNQHLSEAGQPAMAPAEAASFMLTPLVIAMSRPMADRTASGNGVGPDIRRFTTRIRTSGVCSESFT